jgi:hypothetical protein
MRCGTFSIGYVEEVNGTGAQEVQEFLPTRHELLQLVKYWARVDVDINTSTFAANRAAVRKCAAVPSPGGASLESPIFWAMKQLTKR